MQWGNLIFIKYPKIVESWHPQISVSQVSLLMVLFFFLSVAKMLKGECLNFSVNTIQYKETWRNWVYSDFENEFKILCDCF